MPSGSPVAVFGDVDDHFGLHSRSEAAGGHRYQGIGPLLGQ
ncbi:MAG: hypothetical protein ABI239_07740 [Aquihabitans sp.]